MMEFGKGKDSDRAQSRMDNAGRGIDCPDKKLHNEPLITIAIELRKQTDLPETFLLLKLPKHREKIHPIRTLTRVQDNKQRDRDTIG